MIRAPLRVTLHLHAPRDREKPPVLTLAAAFGRQPHPDDLDHMPPPLGAMVPFPTSRDSGDGAADDLARGLVREALRRGGTAIVSTAPDQAGTAERWLRETAEGRG